MTQYFVVLIETAGNQRTIFLTNRQRESLGASELIHRVGTRYVLEALGRGETFAKETTSDPTKLDRFLLDPAQNRPIESTTDTKAAEIVIATSGKAILIVRDRARGEAIVTHVTRRTLIASPGVTVRGALAPIEGGAIPSAVQLDDAIFKAHQRHEELAALLPSADARFPRLPFVEDCASSGLPATRVWSESEPKGPIAEPLDARRAAHTEAIRRMSAALASQAGPARLTQDVQRLEKKGYAWTAVVHADGNGLGGVFLNFADTAFRDKVGTTTIRDYIEALRSFSIAIDRCTRTAAQRAIEETWPAKECKELPLIPLVLGGDDLTVLCDGGRAIPFTVAFLRAFEEETRECKAVTSVVPRGLSACAGIAIVKSHFPFHRAYELAEDLIKSAKTVKEKASLPDETRMPCSAFDFQVVFDTSVSGLEEIRARMTARDDSGASLTFRPYVVSDAKGLEGLSGKAWLELHHFDKLMACKDLLLAPAQEDSRRDGGLALPRSQQHMLRWALSEGKTIADARLDEIRHRYGLDWERLAPQGSLFSSTDGLDCTYLLDAMDLADLEAATEKGPAS